MRSWADPAFWACLERLPPSVQRQAKQRFHLWQANPRHPSLHFKLIAREVWSVRINRDYRALARVRDDLAVWFWIGTHAQYDQLLNAR